MGSIRNGQENNREQKQAQRLQRLRLSELIYNTITDTTVNMNVSLKE